MRKNFMAKLRVLAFSLCGLVLILAFQNCGKVNSLLLAPGQGLAQVEPTASLDPKGDPDPVADVPPDAIGTSQPNFDPGRIPKEVLVQVPDCFKLLPQSESEDGSVTLHAYLYSGGVRMSGNAGKLLLAGYDSVVEIPASSIDSDLGTFEFHATNEQLANYGISGVFAGLGFNAILDQCE